MINPVMHGSFIDYQRKAVMKTDLKNKLGKSLSRGLEIPEEIITGKPRLTLTGTSLLKIENGKGLVEYESDVIRINTSEKLLRIDGKGLNINSVTDEMIEISGEIDCVTYE